MTTHAMALAQTQAAGFLYLEIEGLPYAFGTREVSDADAAAWFAESFDVPKQAFKGIKPWLRAGADADFLPRISAQRVDFINSRVSIGALRIGVADVDGSLAAWCGGWRRDDFLRMEAPANLKTHATTPGTKSVVKLRAGDAANVAVGSQVWVEPDVVYRRVVAVDVAADEIAVTPPLASDPGLGVDVLTDRVAAHPGAGRFFAKGDLREGGATAAWAGETMAFVGMETMTFPALGSPGAGSLVFDDVTRGAYRSRIGEHLAHIGNERVQSLRALVTKYPMQMRGRRVWLKWGLDATKDSETITVFAGTINSLSWTDLGRTLVIECEDAQSWLRQPLFTDLTDRIPPGSTASNVSGGVANPRFLDVYDPNGVVRSDGALGVVSVGRGLFMVGDPAPGSLINPATLIAGHAGAIVDLPVSAAIVTALPGGDPVTGSIPYSHPLEIALAILTSTGAGTNGAYDVLPAEWGLSIPEGDINVDQILDLVAEAAAPACRVVITEPVREAREWMIETLLKPFGYYLTVGVEHPITIAALRAPTPDEAQSAMPITIDDIMIVVDGESVRILIEGPTMENTAVLGAIALSYHPTLVDGKVEFAREQRVEVIGAGDAAAWQSAPDVEIQAWLGDNPTGLAIQADIITHFENLGANMLARFSAPPSILRVTCQMGLVGIAPGRLVSVTLPNLPNAARAARGMTGELFEVWSREVDLARGVVVLELAQTNIVVQRTRYLAPVCSITGVSEADTYAVTKTVNVLQNDWTPGDGVNDTDAFEVGDAVRLYSDDLGTRSVVTTIAIKTTTSVKLAAAVQIGGVDPWAGCHLQLADYGEVGAEAKQRWAFRAGADGLLGGVDAPHVHA